MLTTSLLCLTCFVQKHSLKGCPVEQFLPILGISSCVWKLLQTVFETGQDCFKISSQSDVPTLVEAIRFVYDFDSVSTPSPDVEMAVDILVAEEVTY